MANTADVDAMIKDVIKRYGSLDILVNNAGITRDNLIMKMSEEDFDAVIDANLKGCFNTIKAVIRQMLNNVQDESSILPTVSGILGNAGQANYAASKAGIISLNHGKRAGKPRYHGQWHCAGLRGYGDDPGAL